MIELTLPNMTCGHCVQTVTHAVHGLDPQARVQVDLATRQVRVESALPRDRLVKALAAEGYPAQE